MLMISKTICPRCFLQEPLRLRKLVRSESRIIPTASFAGGDGTVAGPNGMEIFRMMATPGMICRRSGYTRTCHGVSMPCWPTFHTICHSFQQVTIKTDGPPKAGATWFLNGNQAQRLAYNPSRHPNGDGSYKSGFDLLSDMKVAKNAMTVGAANDAVTSGQRDVSKATLASFSSTGPTDDGRIKPDIVANGVDLLSAGIMGDSTYSEMEEPVWQHPMPLVPPFYLSISTASGSAAERCDRAL